MAEEGNVIVPIIGYILALIIPLIGVIFGGALYFMKADKPYYAKHGKYIIIVAVIVAIISIILNTIFGFSTFHL